MEIELYNDRSNELSLCRQCESFKSELVEIKNILDFNGGDISCETKKYNICEKADCTVEYIFSSNQKCPVGNW